MYVDLLAMKYLLSSYSIDKSLKILPLGTGGSDGVDVTLFQRQRRWNGVISALFEPLCAVGQGLDDKTSSLLQVLLSPNLTLISCYFLYTHYLIC